jgi:hypothetical protein
MSQLLQAHIALDAFHRQPSETTFVNLRNVCRLGCRLSDKHDAKHNVMRTFSRTLSEVLERVADNMPWSVTPDEMSRLVVAIRVVDGLIRLDEEAHVL